MYILIFAYSHTSIGANGEVEYLNSFREFRIPFAIRPNRNPPSAPVTDLGGLRLVVYIIFSFFRVFLVLIRCIFSFLLATVSSPAAPFLSLSHSFLVIYDAGWTNEIMFFDHSSDLPGINTMRNHWPLHCVPHLIHNSKLFIPSIVSFSGRGEFWSRTEASSFSLPLFSWSSQVSPGCIALSFVFPFRAFCSGFGRRRWESF